jgi:anti-sigma-K factor RskA
VRGHLPGCQRCARAAAEYTATADLMAIAVDQVQPTAELRSRIMAEVYASAPARARAPQGRQPARHGWLRRLWHALPSGRGFTAGGALAAAAAVALLVVAVARGGGGPVSSPVRGTVGELTVQGSLTYYRQTQTAVLSVHGLTAQPSQVYEVWLVRSSNSVTPAGYLTEQPDGSWSVAIHGSLSGYSAVAATVEPSGGSPTPTGRQVLAGTLPSS